MAYGGKGGKLKVDKCSKMPRKGMAKAKKAAPKGAAAPGPQWSWTANGPGPAANLKGTK